MRQQLLDLYEIQKIDLDIHGVEKRKADIPKHVHELEATIEEIRVEIVSITEQRDVLEKEMKALDGGIHAETDKIRKWERRLNDIRNQREYLALSREVEGSKRQNRDAEEKILEHMQQRDLFDTQLDELQDKLAIHEVDCDTERKRVEGELAQVEAEVASGVERREALLHKIPKALLRRYDFVRTKRLGVGLVVAPDGSCSGCNMRLPPQLYNTLQRANTIEECPSCQRIVFWEGILEVPEEGGEQVEATA